MVARFAPKRARDVPLFVAGLPIFSRAYYAAKPFDETTLEVPLGSGPYKVGRFEPGRFIEYQRVKDWWGAELPVARGQNNFDVVRFEYYRDREVGFEGFSAKTICLTRSSPHAPGRRATISRRWKNGRVKRDVLPDDTPSGAQGWFINTRRAKLPRSPAARGAVQRVRLRMDEQDHHVRFLRPHRVRCFKTPT